MLTNYHTHSIFCDGKNTPEEVVLSAIDMGFDAIGFSGHGYTAFDLTYCMKDTEGYIKEINNLKEKYKNKIQIYLGVEEDAFYPLNHADYDYTIGSSHYFNVDGKYYPIDSNYDCFKKCLELFGYDIEKLTNAYYSNFCEYLSKRKPDIVGHFDLITKFDEMDDSLFLENKKYLEIAQKYVKEVLKNDVIFEVNTGAISRGYRKQPYPHIDLLHTIKKQDGKLILSSDSHAADAICSYFEDAKLLLKDVGFQYVYVLFDGEFKKDYI